MRLDCRKTKNHFHGTQLMFTTKKKNCFFLNLLCGYQYLRFECFGLGAEAEEGRHGINQKDHAASSTCEYRTRLLLLILLIPSTLSRLCNTRHVGHTSRIYYGILFGGENLEFRAKSVGEKRKRGPATCARIVRGLWSDCARFFVNAIRNLRGPQQG